MLEVAVVDQILEGGVVELDLAVVLDLCEDYREDAQVRLSDHLVEHGDGVQHLPIPVEVHVFETDQARRVVHEGF